MSNYDNIAAMEEWQIGGIDFPENLGDLQEGASEYHERSNILWQSPSSKSLQPRVSNGNKDDLLELETVEYDSTTLEDEKVTPILIDSRLLIHLRQVFVMYEIDQRVLGVEFMESFANLFDGMFQIMQDSELRTYAMPYLEAILQDAELLESIYGRSFRKTTRICLRKDTDTMLKGLTVVKSASSLLEKKGILSIIREFPCPQRFMLSDTSRSLQGVILHFFMMADFALKNPKVLSVWNILLDELLYDE